MPKIESIICGVSVVTFFSLPKDFWVPYGTWFLSVLFRFILFGAPNRNAQECQDDWSDSFSLASELRPCCFSVFSQDFSSALSSFTVKTSMQLILLFWSQKPHQTSSLSWFKKNTQFGVIVEVINSCIEFNYSASVGLDPPSCFSVANFYYSIFSL